MGHQRLRRPNPGGAGTDNHHRTHTRTPVGASLLAIRFSHSTSMSADTPRSPASRLLQLIGVGREFSARRSSLVGAGLLAMAVSHSAMMLADTPRSPASWLLRKVGFALKKWVFIGIAPVHGGCVRRLQATSNTRVRGGHRPGGPSSPDTRPSGKNRRGVRR
jgi:hypothetical protein